MCNQAKSVNNKRMAGGGGACLLCWRGEDQNVVMVWVSRRRRGRKAASHLLYGTLVEMAQSGGRASGQQAAGGWRWRKLCGMARCG